MDGIVNTVHKLLIRVVFRTGAITLTIILVTIFQIGFACLVVMRIGIGIGGLARLIIICLNAIDGLHDTINILLIDEVVIVLKSDARLEGISTAVLNGIFVDEFLISDSIFDRFCLGHHQIGCDDIVFYHSEV